jgi:putative DNA primase/helicase
VSERERLEDTYGTVAPERRPLTDDGNAYRLIDLHGKDLRYIPGESWHWWDGTRWLRDSSGESMRRARALVETLREEAAAEADKPDDKRDDKVAKALKQHARNSASRRGLEAMLAVARSDRRAIVDVAELDADPLSLNALNGTIDLRSGRLRPHERGDLITRRTTVAYDPEARAPTWEAFTRRVLPDEAVRAYMQRLAGLAAMGHNADELLHVFYGSGANGKTKYVHTICSALGDYAATAGAELLLAGQRRSSGQPELVRLRGVRLLAAGETDESARLSVALVKSLTGGDTISARLLYANEVVEFVPVFSPWLVTNHKPTIPEQSEGIWRRVRLVPFTVTIPKHERDLMLQGKLLAELEGVLAWIVEGARMYLADGLVPPKKVTEATSEYRDEENLIASFVAEQCETAEGYEVAASVLYAAWRHWCEASNEEPGTQNAFGRRLSDLRDDSGQPLYPTKATAAARVRLGLRLRQGR